ncbi:hypothetical protein BJF78_08775 [Pseudonocardia sp. CNS-139]|nr:hypothetical protein BJF78_08775 [Pseudonocardia sp. CNS-139]
MRIRTLAGAALVAAGLSVTLTGAAGATPSHDTPPEADVLVVRCEDGNVVTRPLTDDERARLKEVRARVEAGGIPAGVAHPVPGQEVRVVVVEGRPVDVEKIRKVREGATEPGAPVLVRALPEGGVACAVPARPVPPPAP